MSTRDRVDEFKIGLFVLAAVAILVTALLRLDVVRTEPRQILKTQFNFTGGLETGAVVQMAGVPIGEVQSLKIIRTEAGKTAVEVTAGVDPHVVIPSDSQIGISTHGLLGTKYLEIRPGMLGARSTDDVFAGKDPVQIDAMIAAGERMALKMERTVDLVNQLVEDQDFKSALKTNGENVSGLIFELRQAARSINEILDGVKGGRGLIGKMLTDETVYADVRETVADIKRNPWKLWKKR